MAGIEIVENTNAIKEFTIGLQLVGDGKQRSSLARNANVVVSAENRPRFNVQLNLRKNRWSKNHKNEECDEEVGFAHFAFSQNFCEIVSV